MTNHCLFGKPRRGFNRGHAAAVDTRYRGRREIKVRKRVLKSSVATVNTVFGGNGVAINDIAFVIVVSAAMVDVPADVAATFLLL